MSDETPIPATNGRLPGSESQDKVCAALAAAQAQMPAAAFDSNNPFFHSRYASLGAVIEASQPILKVNGLAIFQVPLTDGQTVSLKTRIVHASGQWLDGGTLSLPVGDPKGKSLIQEAGSIITYLRRYAWSSVLGMYADEDTDGGSNRTAQRQPDKPEIADASTR